MKKITICWHCILSTLKKIHLVDKFLIIFMIVLLLQSAYNLFVNHVSSTETNNIDVIIRTSTAAIFGYFLSANFIRHASSYRSGGSGSNGPTPAKRSEEAEGRSETPIDSDKEMQLNSKDTGHDQEPASEPRTTNRLQVIAAACIGLFCMIILLVFRNVLGQGIGLSLSASTTATIAQFRDIVSGCVGFLIGCPTSKRNIPK